MMAAPAQGPAAAIAATRARRHRRAAVAQRLLAKGGDAIAAIDWDGLDRAPEWLSLAEPQLAILMRQVGAVVCAPQIRLWIDGPRVAAAREALGECFMRALAAQRDAPQLPGDLAPQARIDEAGQVAGQLQSCGAAVLLATLTDGLLRRAAAAAFAPATAAPMAVELAQSLIQSARALAAQGAAPAAKGGKS